MRIEQINQFQVNFIGDDDRVVYTVSIAGDTHSIFVKAIDTTINKGVLYDNKLIIKPRTSDVVVISTEKYEK